MTDDPLHLIGPDEQVGVGVVVPYDMALDREMWRWTPAAVSLYFTRTPFAPLSVSVEMAEAVSDGAAVCDGVRDLHTVSPAVIAYGCTSGSFVNGISGELALTQQMVDAGAPAAITTSGALLAALSHLGSKTVAVATPYDTEVTMRLESFLDEAGVGVVGSAHLGLKENIWRVPYRRTVQLVLDADHDGADAVFVSCTNLPTYDVITTLEQLLGKPVLTANQVTMWAALQACGHPLIGPGQQLAESGVTK